MLRIQAVPTWSCPYYGFKYRRPGTGACAYCNLYADSHNPTFVDFGSKRLQLGREITPDQWAEGTRLVSEEAGEQILFDFTGGEPTMYPRLGKLLELCAPYSEWAITSNSVLTNQIRRLFEFDIKPCRSWTASWHPGAFRPMEPFLDNLRFVQSNAVYVSVTIVLHESTKTTIKRDLARLQDEGFVTQIHLYLGEGYALERDADQEIHDLYAELKHLNRAPAEDWDQTPSELPTPRNCIAGHRSVAVSSDGSVFRCYEHLMVETQPAIGKWGSWTPEPDLTRNCDWVCRFACDTRNVIYPGYSPP